MKGPHKEELPAHAFSLADSNASADNGGESYDNRY